MKRNNHAVASIWNLIFNRDTNNPKYRRNFSIVAFIAVGAIVSDYVLGFFFDILKEPLAASNLAIEIFAVISFVLYGPGQYFFLSYARKISEGIKMPSLFNRFATLVRYIQYGILLLLTIIMAQMVLASQYPIGLFICATILGTFPGAGLYAMLAHRLFSWYRSNRRTVMILFLALAASTGAIAMSGNVIILAIVSSENPTIIRPQGEANFGHVSSSPTLNLLFYFFEALMAVISALFQWAGISLLMRHFSKKIGKARYWFVVCVPATLLLAGMAPSILGGSPTSNLALYDQSKISFRILTAIGASSIQIVWGLGYLSIAKSVKKVDPRSPIIGYMTVTAYGILLTGFAFSSSVIFVTYPPFGLAGHSYLTLAAYLFSLGFYSSAISVTEDARLRHSIRRFVSEEARLVDSIAAANLEQQIEKKVLIASRAAAAEMSSETGVDPNLSDEDIKEYLGQVLKEMKGRHNKEESEESKS